MKKKNKIGILTTVSIFLSKIVYGKDIAFQTKYGVGMADLYGVEPITSRAPSAIASASSNVLVTIGKIAIIPVVLLVGIFAIVKITGKKNKKDNASKNRNDLYNRVQDLYGVMPTTSERKKDGVNGKFQVLYGVPNKPEKDKNVADRPMARLYGVVPTTSDDSANSTDENKENNEEKNDNKE